MFTMCDDALTFLVGGPIGVIERVIVVGGADEVLVSDGI